jgi:uncharacterized membrane protein
MKAYYHANIRIVTEILGVSMVIAAPLWIEASCV